MPRDKALSLLSLAAKAGRVKSGEFMTERTVKTHAAVLVIVAEDASDNTKKQFRDLCRHHRVPMALYSTKEELGHSIGRGERASLAVTDPGFAEGLKGLGLHLEDEGRPYGKKESI